MIDLQGLDIGSPRQRGTAVAQADGYVLTAGGTDIWEAADQFHFASRPVDGDFDWKVKVESLELCHPYTKAGLMVRQTLDADSVHFFHLVFPDNRHRNNNSGGFEAQFRIQKGRGSLALYPVTGDAEPAEFPVVFPDAWLRLKREGLRITAFVGRDGQTWSQYATMSLDLPQRVHVGLAVTAHDPEKTARAVFSHLQG